MQSLAPSEYFPGIKFNYSFYTTGDTKVTLEYVNNNFLKCTGYAYSRAIATSFNGIIYALGGIEGSGAGLTNLNASNISTGIVNDARIPTLAIGKISGLQGSLDAKQATLIPGKGITISADNTINSLWQNPAVLVTFDSVHTVKRVRIGSLVEAEALLQLTGNATNGGTLRLEYLNNTPTFEMIRATGTTSSLYNWTVYNDDNFKIASKNLATAYTCLLYTSPSPRDGLLSRMPSSA